MVFHYKYYIEDLGGDESDAYDFSSKWDPSELRYIAEDMAKDFFDKHDGWECSWPLTFTIMHDGVSLGNMEVRMDMVPKFYASF
jgi:hypothetical protein